VKQYPHTIIASIVPGTTSRDENGNWQPDASADITYQCRYEPAGGNAFFEMADGQRVNYSGIIYMPVSVDDIPVGTKVTVTGILTETVKRFSRGQLNARAWI
jgi:hypothetical protein